MTFKALVLCIVSALTPTIYGGASIKVLRESLKTSQHLLECARIGLAMACHNGTVTVEESLTTKQEIHESLSLIKRRLKALRALEKAVKLMEKQAFLKKADPSFNLPREKQIAMANNVKNAALDLAALVSQTDALPLRDLAKKIDQGIWTPNA